MKKLITKSLAMLSFAIALFSCSESTDNSISYQGTNETTKDVYIILTDNGNSITGKGDISASISKLSDKYNIPQSDIICTYDKVVKGFAAKLSAEQFELISKDKEVVYSEKDQYIISNDMLENILSYKQDKTLAQTTPNGVMAIGGYNEADLNTGVAWIVDTGIDMDHPDLNVNQNLSRSFVSYGVDLNNPNDFNGHGTHVAGIVAAKNNSFGVVGVCAGAELISVKVLNQNGAGSVSQIILGLNYIQDNLVEGKINVVNMSLTGGASTALDNAVRSLSDAGAYIVVAAGNNSRLSAYYSPARVNYTRVYTISAHNTAGQFATNFSNFGTVIDFSAPGVSIFSTYKDGTYATMSGTSMATPHVTGILLANDGSISYQGLVTNDRDSNPDKKAHK